MGPPQGWYRLKAIPTRAGNASSGCVRRAVLRDVDRVTALWTELAEHHARLDPRHALRAGAPDEIRRFAAAELADPDAVALLYEQGGQALGLCMVRIEHAPPIVREV